MPGAEVKLHLELWNLHYVYHDAREWDNFTATLNLNFCKFWLSLIQMLHPIKLPHLGFWNPTILIHLSFEGEVISKSELHFAKIQPKSVHQLRALWNQ